MYCSAQLRLCELHPIGRRVTKHFEQVINGQIDRFCAVKLGKQTA